MTTYLANAFSLNMLDLSWGVVRPSIQAISLPEAMKELSLGFVSIVGHQSTADIFGDTTCMVVRCNRVTTTLETGDRVIVGQYSGPRLEEGTKQLPPGAQITWVMVTI